MNNKHIYYKIYSLVTLPISSLHAAVEASLNKGVEQNKLSPTFSRQVSDQWDRLVEGKQGGSTDNATVNKHQDATLSQVASKKDAE